MESQTDEELVARFRAEGGDPRGNPHINELFARNYEKVACLCLRFTGDRSSALDVAQDVFISAYLHLDSFRGDSKFSTWLYAIARNQCFNAMRARKSRSWETSQPPLFDFPDTKTADPHEQMVAGFEAAVVKEAFEQHLDEMERRVISLHYGQELPLETVTRLLGLTNASGAKAHIVSARRKLRAFGEKLKARRRRGGITPDEQQN